MGKTYDIIPSSLKTSLLVNRQVPEFVREEHPLFISFLEAYYEFLENEQGVQNNDLTKTSKDLRYLHDVDFSIDSFEDSFLNQYANLVPKDVKIDKAFLIKNLLPLYLAKGNPKSFQLLFRMFFGEEVEVIFPKDQLLRASDGQYASESILTISDKVTSFYKGTGSNNQSILLAQRSTPDQFDLRINGIKKENGTDYVVRVEDQKVFFNDVVAVKKDIQGNVVVGTNLSFIDIKSSSPSYNLQSFVDSSEIVLGRTTITFKDATSGGDVTKTILQVSNSTNLQVTSAYANANTFGDNTSFITTSSVSATPASNADIRVTYKDFNDGLFKNRQFTGSTSNSSVVVERVFPRKIDILPKIELFFDPRKSDGSFEQSEEVTSTILVQNTVINISTNTFSSIEQIKVDKGGRLYNIGDPVNIIAGGFSRKARAQVASLGTEFLSNGTVTQGGAGFSVGGLFQGGNTETGFVLYTTIPAIDISGNNTPNTFLIMGESYDATVTNNSSQTYADLIIANANGTYTGAFGNTQVATPTVDTRIKHVVNSTVQAVQIGPVQNVLLVTSNTTTTNLSLDGSGALVEVAARTTADIGSLKGLGKLQMASSNGVANAGNNYTVGDIIEFSSTGAGDGALARVSETNAKGHIINTEFEYPHYENFGTGIRSSVVNIAAVVANTGFRGVAGIPNVYVSSVVVDAINITQPNVNVGLSGVYMTPQANHSGFNFHKGDNPVRVGDIISILGHERKVTNVSSNISIPGKGMFHESGFLTVDRPFPNELDFIQFGNNSFFGTRGLANSLDPTSISAQSANVFGAPMSIDTNFAKGGAAYDTSHLPSVTVFRTNLANETASSANAVINVACLLGDGEEIVAETNNETEGTITTIRITDAGDGYVAIPDIDLTGSGDANATGTAFLTDSVSTTEGRFTSSDGLLSSRERKIQGENFYQDFVYVTKVPLEFSKYKTVLKGLLHPAGYKNYAEFEAREISNVNVSTSGTVSNSIPGTINVSNSISVVGTNTAFNIAVLKGTISVGTSKLAVNGENRVIVSVVSNSSLTVESAFTQVSTGQSAIILV
jgi:hypothetical protein